MVCVSIYVYSVSVGVCCGRRRGTCYDRHRTDRALCNRLRPEGAWVGRRAGNYVHHSIRNLPPFPPLSLRCQNCISILQPPLSLGNATSLLYIAAQLLLCKARKWGEVVYEETKKKSFNKTRYRHWHTDKTTRIRWAWGNPLHISRYVHDGPFLVQIWILFAA